MTLTPVHKYKVTHLKNTSVEFIASQADNTQLAHLCGVLDENLRQIEQAFEVTLKRRGHRITVSGRRAKSAIAALEILYSRAHEPLSIDEVQLALVGACHVDRSPPEASPDVLPPAAEVDHSRSHTIRGTRRANLRARTPTQCEYLHNIQSHDLTFGIGPAGTGKTFLAVACAIDAYEHDQIKRIVLTRPAVEAGERLGFLPGDFAQKVDPYLRPLYDALYDLLGVDKTTKLFERRVIEIAPLAYMRGRTLNHAFIILDEAQNTTSEQMKMFLTRIGFGSKAVVTGDVTQIDLPRTQKSGLIEASRVLQDVHGIALTQFKSVDVLRHPLVARIVEAYEAAQTVDHPR
jgi:phosphate starvation-inducible protein PhoH and related proteins